MGAGHGVAPAPHAATRLQALPAQCKLVATVAFVLAVVATPREAFWAFGVYAAVLAIVARAAAVPLPALARRLAIEAPFVAFAVFLPFVGGGARVDAGPLSLSVDGLWAAWNILVKGTLGVAASVLLASTTPVADLLRGLERLRLPRVFTGITGFMIRYGEVIAGEMHRMRIARISRGHDPRWLWQARAVAASAGTLFVRAFERGERVYLAMVSRGYAGALPALDDTPVARRDWAVALTPAIAAALVAAAAWTVAR